MLGRPSAETKKHQTSSFENVNKSGGKKKQEKRWIRSGRQVWFTGYNTSRQNAVLHKRLEGISKIRRKKATPGSHRGSMANGRKTLLNPKGER